MKSFNKRVCPRCEGELDSKVEFTNGKKIFYYICYNKNCSWNDYYIKENYKKRNAS